MIIAWDIMVERWRAEREAARQLEEDLWQAGYRSKPRHLRKRWRSRKGIGCDTRRHRADGKLLGGHHERWFGDKRTGRPWLREERRIGKYIAYCYQCGLDEEDFIPHTDLERFWDEGRPNRQW